MSTLSARPMLQQSQKINRFDYGSTSILFKVEELLVAGHNVIRVGGERALEDFIIVGIPLDDVQFHVWSNQLADAEQQKARFLDPLLRPGEIAPQHFQRLVKNGLR